MEHNIDIHALTLFFESKYSIILRVARAYVPTHDLVYDVLQHVFIDFIQLADKERWNLKESDLTPHLIRLTKFRAIKIWRRHQKHTPEHLKNLDEHFMFRLQEGSTDSEPVDRIDQLRDCLKKLPEEARKLVERHYFEGISVKDIARTQRSNVAAVRQVLYRIRLKLRECIDKTNR